MSSQPVTPTVRDYFIGAQVAGYRITSKLGEGAMGVVYRGEHNVLGRPAAIKFLNSDLAENEELVGRFFTEAKAVNGIRHPNIVDITDFGQRGTRHYYVMEFLDGQTLLERLTLEGRTDVESTIRIGTQIAAALAAAHEKGIVHRDLKPENIYLCNHPDYPDYVKVFDFGIAKLIEKSPVDTHRTRAGYVLGTPLYMSPEQCIGSENLDHRSDVYSLGVVLYQMITGVVPFNAPTLAGIVQGHIGVAPERPKSHNSSIPDALEELILGALEKDPDDRIPDMRTMRALLEVCDGNSGSVELEPIAGDSGGAPRRYRGRASAPPPVEEGASDKLIGELITIILERIENDRLVLPAMPASAMRAIRELENPNVTFRAISKIIGDDPVLAPQIFRRASTAQFGNAERPRTVEQAISRLGMGTLKSVLIELSAHQVYDSRNRKIRKTFKGIWDHTVAVATASRMVAENLDVDAEVDPQTAHLAGLMHDVGKPIVGALLLEAEKMLGMKKKDWLSPESWAAVVEQSHRRVGTALAKKWELPDAIVAVIAASPDYSSDPEDVYSNIVLFANAFAKRCGKACGEFDEEVIEDIVTRGVDFLGLDWVFVHDALREAIASAGKSEAEGAGSTQAIAR